MSFGIHHLARAIEDITQFLKKAYTNDIKNALKSALKAVGNLGNNPKVTHIISQLDQLFSSENIDSAMSLINQARDILAAVDPDHLNGVFASLNEILQQANQAGLIDNITQVLETLNTTGGSINNLLNVVQELMVPAKFAVYGVGGWLVSTGIMQAVQTFLAAKGDGVLQQILQANMQQLYVSIGQLRQLAAQTLALAANPAFNMVEAEPILAVPIEEARNILRHTRPMDARHLEVIRQVQEKVEQMLIHLYQAQLQRAALSEMLDRIVVSPTLNWSNILQYTRKYQLSLRRPVDHLRFRRDQMSYEICKRLYNDDTRGEDNIGNTMKSLTKTFCREGGDAIYRRAANTLQDSASLFQRISEMIVGLTRAQIEKHKDFLEDWEDWQNDVLRLKDAYDKALSKVQTLWQEARSADAVGNDATLVNLPDEACRVIVARAFAEFYAHEVKYFGLILSMPREVYQGLLDLPRSLYGLGVGAAYTIAHPKNASRMAGTVAKDLLRSPYDALVQNENVVVDAVGNIARSAYHHPTRMLTSTALTIAISNYRLPPGPPGPSGPPPPPPSLLVDKMSTQMKIASVKRGGALVGRATRVQGAATSMAPVVNSVRQIPRSQSHVTDFGLFAHRRRSSDAGAAAWQEQSFDKVVAALAALTNDVVEADLIEVPENRPSAIMAAPC